MLPLSTRERQLASLHVIQTQSNADARRKWASTRPAIAHGLLWSWTEKARIQITVHWWLHYRLFRTVINIQAIDIYAMLHMERLLSPWQYILRFTLRTATIYLRSGCKHYVESKIAQWKRETHGYPQVGADLFWKGWEETSGTHSERVGERLLVVTLR